MPESTQPTRPAHPSKPTTPEDYPASPIQPSGDYSYTLEIVMGMQRSMGSVVEAIDGLKQESKEHRAKLEEIGRDVHSAKTVGKVLLALATLAITGFGVAVAAFAALHHR